MGPSSVSLAVVDATAGPTARGTDHPGTSRYETPIANVPLLGHVMDELGVGGITRARVVVRRNLRRQLARLLSDGGTRGIEVSFVDAHDERPRIEVLAQVERALVDEPVLLHPGDCFYRDQLGAMHNRFREGDVDAVLPEQASVDPLRAPTDRRATKDVVYLGPGTKPLLEDLLSPAGEGEDLLALLLSSDCRLAVCAKTQHWCYDGSTSALLAANRMMLDTLPDELEQFVHLEGNRIHGRVLMSPRAYVTNSSLYGPITIGDRAVIEDSFIGPYSAIGPDAILSGTEIDNSMVLTGAEIRHPGIRIEGSIIGERARVTRSFDLPRGLHMRVGSDAHISLS